MLSGGGADQLLVSVTAAIAPVLGKIVVYTADETGRPTRHLLETATLGFSVVAASAATVALTLHSGVIYWLANVGLGRNEARGRSRKIPPPRRARIRQILTIVGKVLVLFGYVRASDIEPANGALLTIVSVI